MKNSFKKIILLLLIVGMNWSVILLIVGTDAYFNDTEVSGNNILTAGALDFRLSGDNFAPKVNLGQDVTKTISVLDTDSTMDYSYKVRVDSASLSGGLCDYLFLKDDLTETPNISLADFESDHEVLYSEKQNWTFAASLNTPTDSNWKGEICNFDFVYEGNQKDYDGGSFSDVERISNTITAAGGNWQKIEVSNVIVNPLQNEYCGTCQGSNNSYCAPGLYYKQQLNITWETTNALANTDLLFDIVYITDSDCSGDISGGDERFVVVSGKSIMPVSPGNYAYVWTGWVDNDDLHRWNTNNKQWWKYHKDDGSTDDVPYFYGYAWIEIIAAEQGNFTASDSDTSMAMFEPLPPGLSIDNIQSIIEEFFFRDEHCPAPGLENCLEENFKADGFVKSTPIPSQKRSGGGGGGTQGGGDEDEIKILKDRNVGKNSGDGGDPDGDDGRGSDDSAATNTTTDATDNADDKDPTVTDLSSQEDASAANDDNEFSITNNLDESRTVDDDGEEEGIDLPFPITNNSDGGDNGGGEESAPDSFDDDSARVSEII